MLRTTSTRLHVPAARPVRLVATLLLGLAFTSGALAAPEGEEIINGDVTFHRDGSVTLIRASDGAIIEYDSFDIFADEVVEFVQPGADARVLNRVFGEATRIEGALLANGIVYIVNPGGIFIDGEAVVDVGGLVAASGHISNEDFLAGTDHFELTGPVENASDSVEAQSVSLLGTSVANLGQISAPDGTIALVAGDRVVLTRLGGRIYVEVDGPPADMPGGTGVVQAGRVDAGGGQVIFAVGDHYSLAINHEGVTRGHDVELRGGEDGLLVVRGEIDASGAGAGGSIDVTGDAVALLGARLDASGDTGGGAIRVGGDRRGEGPLPNARRTFVDSESRLVADAIETGDGGSVIVWGDEAAVMKGSISARGGAAAGDGGFAEISSPGALSWDGDVDLGADSGEAGTLLFDPQDIVILGGTADGSDDPNVSATELAADDDTLGTILFGDLGDLADPSDPFEIYESEIEGTNANIVLEATNSVRIAGTFDNQVAGEGNDVVFVGGGNDLTIRTRNDTGDDAGSAETPRIDLGSITWRTDGGDVTIETGADAVAFDTVADVTVGDITTAGGGVDISTRNGAIAVGNIDTSGAQGSIGADAGAISLVARGEGTSALTAGDLTAIGGVGTAGDGGSGGATTATSEDGAVQVGRVDTRGGAGIVGGDGGAVSIETTDADASGDSFIVVNGDIRTAGGEGRSGNGGVGGEIGVLALATPGSPIGMGTGGGDVTIAGDVDASGGDGTEEGGNAGFIRLVSQVTGSVEAGNLTSRGGDGGDGGGGRAGGFTVGVRVRTDDGSITLGAIDASGGDGAETALRGGAGGIEVTAGAAADGAGSITLSGPITATDGAGAGDVRAGVELSLVAVDALEFDPGIAGPQITTTENVLLAGSSVGATTQIQVDAVETPELPGAEGMPPQRLVRRTLEVNASDVGDVVVTSEASFNTLVAIATSAEADIDVVQVGNGTTADSGTSIDIDGAPGVSTVAAVDGLDGGVGGGVDVQVELRDALEGDDDVNLELAIADGAIQAGAALRVFSEDDVTLGDGAITMQPLPGDDAVTGLLGITADRDFDGVGDIEASAGTTQISTEGSVQLAGVSVGGAGAIGIDAVSIPDSAPELAFGGRGLTMVVSEAANVEVTNGAFSAIGVRMGSAETDVDLVQVGGGTVADPGVVIDVDGAPGVSTLTRLESTDDAVPGGVSIELQLVDDLIGVDDESIEFLIPSGAIDAASSIRLRAEDDVVLADGAIAMGAPDPSDPTQVADVEIAADFADADGSGAIRSSGGTPIDMGASAGNAGRLDLLAGSGIGSSGSPFDLADASDVSASVSRSGGIHLRTVAGADFALVSAAIADGDGDVEITSTSGDLRIAGPVSTSGDGAGNGGAVSFAATEPDARVRFDGAGLRIAAAGAVTVANPVDLLSSVLIEGEGDVTFSGEIDGSDAVPIQRRLIIDTAGTTRFGGDVGATRAILELDVAGDVELAQDTSFQAENSVTFGGNLDATSDDAAAVTIVAGRETRFGGSVGTNGRLSGLTVDSDAIVFDQEGLQEVLAGDGGIRLDENGLVAPPPTASIVKQTGSLSLVSTGDVLVGRNHKLTVEGRVDDMTPPNEIEGALLLQGATVRVGDLNAFEIDVVSDDFGIYSREPGLVQLASGRAVPDRGTDVFANSMETSSAPVAVGTGRAPTITTLSGSVDGAGAGGLLVTRLESPIALADLRLGEQVLDLGIPTGDPGHEVPQQGARVEPLLAAIPGDDPSAGVATPPAAEQVLSFLRCADAKPGPGAAGCAPARGSALDTRRGDEVADRYRRLLGSSSEGQAARRLLAGDLTTPEARAVLRDLATLLIQLRLLGMDDASYEGLRSELLSAAQAGGPGGGDAALLDAIRAQGRGIAL